MSGGRVLPFETRAPADWDARVEEMARAELFMLQTAGPTCFVVKDGTGDVAGTGRTYRVYIGDVNRCTCKKTVGRTLVQSRTGGVDDSNEAAVGGGAATAAPAAEEEPPPSDAVQGSSDSETRVSAVVATDAAAEPAQASSSVSSSSSSRDTIRGSSRNPALSAAREGYRAPHACVHVLFVLIKVLRIPADNPMSWQGSFVDAEVNQILQGRLQRIERQVTRHSFLRRGMGANAASVGANTGNRRQGSAPESDDDGLSVPIGAGVSDATANTDDLAASVERQAIEEDDVCPICQDSIYVAEDSEDAAEVMEFDITWCRRGCGNNLHTRCMRMFAQHQQRQQQQRQHVLSTKSVKVQCPLCRSDWSAMAIRALEEPTAQRRAQARAARLAATTPTTASGELQGVDAGTEPGGILGPSTGQQQAARRVVLQCSHCTTKLNRVAYRCILCTAQPVTLCRRCFTHTPPRHPHHPFVRGDGLDSGAITWTPALRAVPRMRDSTLQDLQGRDLRPADIEMILQFDESANPRLAVFLSRSLPQPSHNDLTRAVAEPLPTAELERFSNTRAATSVATATTETSTVAEGLHLRTVATGFDSGSASAPALYRVPQLCRNAAGCVYCGLSCAESAMQCRKLNGCAHFCHSMCFESHVEDALQAASPTRTVLSSLAHVKCARCEALVFPALHIQRRSRQPTTTVSSAGTNAEEKENTDPDPAMTHLRVPHRPRVSGLSLVGVRTGAQQSQESSSDDVQLQPTAAVLGRRAGGRRPHRLSAARGSTAAAGVAFGSGAGSVASAASPSSRSDHRSSTNEPAVSLSVGTAANSQPGQEPWPHAHSQAHSHSRPHRRRSGPCARFPTTLRSQSAEPQSHRTHSVRRMDTTGIEADMPSDESQLGMGIGPESMALGPSTTASSGGHDNTAAAMRRTGRPVSGALISGRVSPLLHVYPDRDGAEHEAASANAHDDVEQSAQADALDHAIMGHSSAPASRNGERDGLLLSLGRRPAASAGRGSRPQQAAVRRARPPVARRAGRALKQFAGGRDPIVHGSHQLDSGSGLAVHALQTTLSVSPSAAPSAGTEGDAAVVGGAGDRALLRNVSPLRRWHRPPLGAVQAPVTEGLPAGNERTSLSLGGNDAGSC